MRTIAREDGRKAPLWPTRMHGAGDFAHPTNCPTGAPLIRDRHDSNCYGPESAAHRGSTAVLNGRAVAALP